MKERPILMTPQNAQKCHDGTKTQTRRTNGLEEVNSGPWDFPQMTKPGVATFLDSTQANPYNHALDVVCPYGESGDRLWVRENGWERPCRTAAMMRDGADTWEAFYYDALLIPGDAEELKEWEFSRRPSIHMARRYCRTVLEIVDVQVERVQDISEEDVMAEGVNRIAHGRDGYYCSAFRDEPHHDNWIDPVDAYKELWEFINGQGSWERNDWVWVLTFKKVA